MIHKNLELSSDMIQTFESHKKEKKKKGSLLSTDRVACHLFSYIPKGEQ